MRAKSILVVDEAAESRDVLVSILTMQKYRPVAARSIEEAMTCVDGVPPDLVVIDLKFYQQDPWEACRQLRACPALEQVPLVALAPDRPEARAPEQEGLSSCQFLVKPFDYAELVDLIGRELGESRVHPAP